jgi:hypothetical protein
MAGAMRWDRLFSKYLRCWEHMVRMLATPVVFLPLILLLFVRVTALMIAVFFIDRPLSYGMIPVIESLFGDAALHYPTHFVMLPTIYETISAPFVFLVGTALFAWAIFMMSNRLQRKPIVQRQTRSELLSAAPSLFGIMLCFGLVLFGYPALSSAILTPLKAGMIRDAVSAALAFMALVLYMWILYSIGFAVPHRDSILEALAHGARFVARRFVLTVMLAATAFALRAPLGLFLSKPNAIVTKFQPEAMVLLLAAAIVVEFVTHCFLSVSAAYLTLSARKEGGI